MSVFAVRIQIMYVSYNHIQGLLVWKILNSSHVVKWKIALRFQVISCPQNLTQIFQVVFGSQKIILLYFSI